MKLTKRLLAIVLAAAMLVGMVVISTSAVQLDDAVPTLTWEDCENINPDTNPYTVRLGFKVYEVDTASGEYTLIADADSANDIYDVKVKPGSVLRVEIWAQTNFHAYGLMFTPAYTNAWLLPTKMSDYSTFSMKAASTATKVSVEDGMPAVVDFDDSYGAGDGTFENPAYATEAFAVLKGQTNHNQYSGIKGILPASWKGTGSTATNYYSKTAVDQWGDKIADDAGNFRYNVYQFSCGNTVGVELPWLGYGLVLNVYQPVCAFALTVAENAEGSANLFFPEGTYSNVASPLTYVNAFDYNAVIESPDVNGNWDPSMPQVVTSGLTSYKNKVTYADGTQADKNWIVENAVLTVDTGSEGGDDETTTEAPTEPPVEYADLAALQAAIAAAANADTTNCTSASVERFNKALAAANALNVEGTLATKQAEINAAAEELVAAQAALTKLGKCDYAALDAAIAAYEAKVADKALYANWADYEAAYNAAKAVARDMFADEAGANQKAINDAAAALNAVALTYKPADYSAVEAAIAGAQYDASKYTAASVKAVNDAIAAVVYGLDITKQAEVDAYAAAIRDAYAELVPLGKVNYAALDAAIAAYEAKVADKALYTNWADYEAAYNAAKAVARDMIADEAGANQKKVDDAAAALNAVVLEYKAADYSKVAEALDLVRALDPSAYTAASLNAVNNAVAAVKYGYDITKQAEVDAMAKAINDAIGALVPLGNCDYTALDAALAAASAAAANKNGYTPDSWTASDFDNAYANAFNVERNMIADEAGANQAKIDAATKALNDAVAALVPVADKAALAAAIAAAEDLDAADWTPDSWAAADLATVIAAAKAVNDDANATDAAVADAIAALNAAAAKLVEKAETAKLAEAIATLPEIKEEDADPATWAAYVAALNAAQAVIADPNATQEAIDKAEADLLAAIDGVQEKEFVPCDYSDLDDAIAAFEALDAAAYTPTSYAAVKVYYDAAKAIARNLEYTEGNQTLIDEAYDALNSAINRDLVEVADKAALLAEINKAASVEEDLATDATWLVYADALAYAEEVYADAEATQDDVDDAAAELAAANAALATRDLVDYTALDAALALVPAEAEDAYTPATWAAYAAAKAAAEAVARDLVDNKAGTNAKLVADAAAALVDAYNALKINAANITNVVYDNTGCYAPTSLAYTFVVNGGASKIQIIFPDGGTMTFDRRHARVDIVSYNADGEVIDYNEEEPAYEEWTIVLALAAADYKVRAKYDYTWDTENFDFAVEYDEYDAAASNFTVSTADTDAATEISADKYETVTFTAVTDVNVVKVQLVFADGGTSTYSQTKSVDNGDGTRTWTIERIFVNTQNINLKVKTPTGWATEYAGNVVINIG